MKRIFALMLVALMALTVAFAEGAPLAGGWTPAADPAVTEDMKEMFDRALEGLLGVDYVPVAYLGSQVVAGNNHCILAQAKAVVPDAQPYYVLIYLHEDLEGNAAVMNIADFDVGALCTYGADEP